MSRQVWIRVCTAAAASVVVAAAAAVAFADGGGERFRVRDECDAATFNAFGQANGLGDVCNPAFGGDETFQEFINEVTATQTAENWQIQPERSPDDSGE